MAPEAVPIAVLPGGPAVIAAAARGARVTATLQAQTAIRALRQTLRGLVVEVVQVPQDLMNLQLLAAGRVPVVAEAVAVALATPAMQATQARRQTRPLLTLCQWSAGRATLLPLPPAAKSTFRGTRSEQAQTPAAAL